MRDGIPEGRPDAIAELLGPWTRMQADLEENGPGGPFRHLNTDRFAPPGLLAPEEYGLLVVDLAERVILDGQEGHPLDRIPLYRAFSGLNAGESGSTCPTGSDTHRMLSLYRAGRVETLYMPTLGCRADLPQGQPENMLRFLAEVRKRLSLHAHLHSYFTVAAAPLRVERFEYTSGCAIRRMRQRVGDLGFALSPAEIRRWAEHGAP